MPLRLQETTKSGSFLRYTTVDIEEKLISKLILGFLF